MLNNVKLLFRDLHERSLIFLEKSAKHIIHTCTFELKYASFFKTGISPISFQLSFSESVFRNSFEKILIYVKLFLNCQSIKNKK